MAAKSCRNLNLKTLNPLSVFPLIMLSLRFPIPIANSLFPINPKNSIRCSQTSSRRTNLVVFSPKSSSKLLAAATDLVAEEEGGGSGSSVDGGNVLVEGEKLPAGLRRELMPNHVAVIMDGNVRWARRRGLPASFGHEAGVQSLREMVELCCKWGIRVLTIFAFSCDNWVRPKVEVDLLLSLFERGIKSEFDKFVSEGIRISVIGDSSKLPKSLQKLISDTEETTKANSRLQLIVAISYSGQYDIVQACKTIAGKVKDDLIQLEDINEALIERELETNCTEFPCPDLLIRTSGELRVSNFLLWQLAYTELFFARALWPDFREAEFVEALSSFQQRQRRYGGRDS